MPEGQLPKIALDFPSSGLALVKTAVGSVHNPTIARSVDGKLGRGAMDSSANTKQTDPRDAEFAFFGCNFARALE